MSALAINYDRLSNESRRSERLARERLKLAIEAMREALEFYPDAAKAFEDFVPDEIESDRVFDERVYR